MGKTRIYLDWNATAPLLDEARAAMLAALSLCGNPNSVHSEGRAARQAVEKARRQVASLVHASTANLVFTAGATEAASLVLTPDFRMGRSPLKIGRLYVSAIEHPAVRLGGRFDAASVSEIPVGRNGVVDIDALGALLDTHPAEDGLPMVAIMLANNETGVIQPVRAAAALVHAKGGLMVVDAVQAIGRMAVDIEALDADFLIVSSHKIGGPKGAGALVSRGEMLMPKPLVTGGGQEKGHRGGTENVAALAGFGAAAHHAQHDLTERNTRIAGLRDALEQHMKACAPDMVIYGADAPRLPNTIFFGLPGLKSETGQIAFDLEGMALSAGSACSSGKVGQSHVLTAMGLDPQAGGLRISLGATTTADDIDRAGAIFATVAGRRRGQGQAA
ncbi:cysteine desulfurase family protein [Rhizobium halophytocola]|uniref:Cysteine desulfurase n=1 Tax=Rhizobium halophytocola TaxID=735519 RepID=A0ABS4DZF6_9HYPH|nr:cysteine desulfurase family protein [Rhizobium halophytocola]MBP1851068.1 cysteine desulfurase [Rhizobium halophytocola]